MKAEVLQVGTERGKEFLEKLNQDYLTTLTDKKYVNKRYNVMGYSRGFGQIKKIIVHCTATDSEVWDDPIACINYDMIPNHISSKGCPTCTYHFYVEQKGTIYQLVSVYIKTWNCKGHNNDSIAVCINHGGEKKDVIEKEQYESLIDTICYIFDFMDWGRTEKELDGRLFFHRDFANKLCPGENLNKKELKKKVMERFEVWGDAI